MQIMLIHGVARHINHLEIELIGMFIKIVQRGIEWNVVWSSNSHHLILRIFPTAFGFS